MSDFVLGEVTFESLFFKSFSSHVFCFGKSQFRITLFAERLLLSHLGVGAVVAAGVTGGKWEYPGGVGGSLYVGVSGPWR